MKLIRNTVIILMLILSLVQPALCLEYAYASVDDSIYEHLKNWDTNFRMDYYDSDVINIIRNEAKHDDYLYLSLIGLVCRKNGKDTDVEAKYRTTKEQETYVDNEVNNIIKAIIKDNMTEYDKVYAINQYLVNRFEYDYTLVNNNSYLALVNNTTTCQGYSMVAYKLFKAAGIDARIIVGQINNINHGWNLVKVDGNWYHVDITNNDSVRENKYFLRSDNFLKSEGFTWEAKDYVQIPYDYSLLRALK